jgi:4-aminobutyrate aminotransferase-like enzyme
MDQPLNDISALDRAHVFHPSTPLGAFARGDIPTRIMTSGEGVYVVDRDGRKSLDAFAGLYCVNTGYGLSEVAADAIYEQTRKLGRLARELDAWSTAKVRRRWLHSSANRSLGQAASSRRPKATG